MGGDNIACIEGGDPSVNPDGWWIVDGAIGEEVESFNEKYPHCLPNTELVYETATTDEQMMMDILSFYENADVSVKYLYGYYDEYGDYTFWPEEYAEELPLYLRSDGNLCTNMYTEVDEATGRVLLAFHDGIFDRSLGPIDSSTAPEDYPQNVKNIASFMTEDDFNVYIQNQIQVDGAGFTTYWDFLSALAMVPGFCNGVAGGPYSRFEDAAMCAKEVASVCATIVTQTNC